MSSCKDCIHHEACDYWLSKERKHLISDEGFICEHFKDHTRFVELPCKVGDKVYVLCVENKIQVKSIRIISILEATVIYYFDDEKFNSSLNDYCCKDDLGETVFLTRAEAEKALEERNNENRSMV